MISLILTFCSLHFFQAIIFILIILFIGILIKVLNLNKNKDFYNNIFYNKFKLYSILIILFVLSLISAIAFVYKLTIILNKNISINIFIFFALARFIFFIYKRDKVIKTFEKYF
ncbi:hypothetical protein CPC_A0283 [Clostridium perfringens C str. JGS1495]|nr:hypothetical protein CPC_A0283 [Clostridium perfringens C str. JGS1495]